MMAAHLPPEQLASLQDPAAFMSAGLAAEVMAQLSAAPIRSVNDIVGSGNAVIVAPHADDETLGCGGLIRTLVDCGKTVLIDIMTDGARSHLNSVSYPPARLAALRRREACRAAETLGLSDGAIKFHNQPDGFLGRDQDLADQAVEQLARRIEASGATAVFVTSVADPHPDHRAAFQLTRLAVQQARSGAVLYSYPIWAWVAEGQISLGGGTRCAWRLDIADKLGIKRKAVECYKSQLGQVIKDAPDGFSLSEAHLDLFLRPFETFVEFAR